MDRSNDGGNFFASFSNSSLPLRDFLFSDAIAEENSSE